MSPGPCPSQLVTRCLDSTILTTIITDQPETRLSPDRLAGTGLCLVFIPDRETSGRDIVTWLGYGSNTGLIKQVVKCSLLYLLKKFIQDGY